jgi:hypothetical protein
MIRLEMLGLIVPRIVLEEFKNNKERVAQESSKSLSAHFRLVREALNKVGGEKERLDSVLAYLDDVNDKIPLIGAEAVDTLDRIQQLMERSEIHAVTISVGLNLSCTKGSPTCNPPMFPDPDRYKYDHFQLGVKALGQRDLGPYQRLDLPMYLPLTLMPSNAFPHPDWYVDAAIIVDYEWPVIHWKTHKVYPIYTGRLGEWLWR